jgi:hypothetical protein
VGGALSIVAVVGSPVVKGLRFAASLRDGPCGPPLTTCVCSAMASHPAASVDGSAEVVLVQDGEVLGDDAGGEPGE